MPLRRLTRRELNNTLRDLLGDDSRPADQLPADRAGTAPFGDPGPLTAQEATLLRNMAEALAASAARSLTGALGCAPGGDETGCARKFVESFGLRAYRRPLAREEADQLVALYSFGRSRLKLDLAGGIGLIVEAVLQSPDFLYHRPVEPGPVVREDGLVRLGPYAVASRLSYFLWGSLPDDKLFAAAAANQLSTPAQIEAEARRLLADPKARGTVPAFFEELLDSEALADTSRDAKLYPEYNEALKAAMRAETRAFVENVTFEGDGRLSALLGARFSFVNQALAGVYGRKDVKGTALARMDLDPAQRKGLLTQPAFLTVFGAVDGSHPVKRGHALYERLLCGHLPPPPNEVPPARPASAGGTTRERFADHANNECGRACHDLIDPLGFAFEHYDGIGRYRTTDNGKPVDASGEVRLDGEKKPFANALELTDHLAASQEVQACVASQWLRFALSRPDTDDDAGSVAHAAAAFTASGADLRELMVAVATSRSFRYRKPDAEEVLK
jgi:hypothetical protein